MSRGLLALALLAWGLAGVGGQEPELRWVSEQLFDAGVGLGGCAIGDVDRRSEGQEVVAVAEDGRVIVVAWRGGRWEGELIAKLPAALTRVTVGELDPASPGLEVAAVGRAEAGAEAGGVAVVLTRGGEGWVAEEVWAGEGELAALAIVDGALIVAGTGPPRRIRRDGRAWVSEALPPLPGPARDAIACRGGIAFACESGELALLKAAGVTVLERREGARARLAALGDTIVVADDDGRLSLLPGSARPGAWPSGARLEVLGSGAAIRGAAIRGAALAELDPEGVGPEVAAAGADKCLRVYAFKGGRWVDRVVAGGEGRITGLACGLLPGSSEPALVAASSAGELILARRAPR